MSSTPTFTVLLPAKGRPTLLRDALLSVLEQSFRDFEVIVSNNGADPSVRQAIADIVHDPRVRYVEQQTVLPMPDHWERISLLARGKHLTVLPDRSVLKQGALATISELHARGGKEAEIVTWSWDLYFDGLDLLQPFTRGEPATFVMESDEVAIQSQKLHNPYPAAAPRGLNSSVALPVLAEIRARTGRAFAPLSPDLTFAYSCLFVRPKLTYINSSLFLSQGISVSNGGTSYLTDATRYLREIGIADPIRYSPVQALLSESLMAEDFFAMCHQFGRTDLLEGLDRADLYLKCLSELDAKRTAGLLPAARIEEFAQAVDAALAREDPNVLHRVNAGRARASNLSALAWRTVRRFLGSRSEYLRPLLVRLRGGKRFGSALEAAGHLVP